MHGINKDKEKILKRLKRIEGQVRGIQKMIEDDKYCIDIITQTSAIKSAISSVEDEMLEAHLMHCAEKQATGGQTKKLQEEILQVYKLKRR